MIPESIAKILESHKTAPPSVPAKASQYKCTACKDTGWIINVVDDHETATMCHCLKRETSLKRLRASGLEPLLREYTFRSYKTAEPYQQHIKLKAKSFCAQDQYKGFYIGGQVGAGKTHICTAICGYFLNQGRSVRYVHYKDMMLQLKGNANAPAEYGRYLKELQTVDVLYVDDLFKTKAGEQIKNTDVEHFFTVINYRYIQKAITLISSEKTLPDVVAIDEAIGSRLLQMTGREYDIRIDQDEKKNYRLRGVV